MAFEFIYGHWSVLEAMRAGRRKLEQLLVSDTIEEKGSVAEILTTAADRGVPIKRVPRRIIDDAVQGGGHQGTALRASPYTYVQTDDVLKVSKTRGEKPFVLLLDLLKDPQNVGALLRVADAVGIHGVFIQERRGVEITPAVVNASSGAVEHLNVVQVVNLVQTMKDLKEKDIWMIGLDAGPNVPPLDKTDLNMNLGLVLGSEGEGMRRLVRDTCDLVLCLPMRGRVASLNVATAGSVALYQAWRARGWEGWAHA
ncbi:MAG: 23S rRNA (guanosine(2251)-2'-O)-methyltransferase RlmB, partial [Chloroflexota bacterium]|nr:23S rRNA (guanosine(2251)-2'-O)-methyltransferase RlmB [Chloroflexota bacterium]